MSGNKTHRALELESLYGIDNFYFATAGAITESKKESKLPSSGIESSTHEHENDGCGSHWNALRDEALSCVKCALHAGRTTVVFGEGSIRSKIVFVGEAPGEDEDRTGRPFVGKAGQILREVIESFIKCEDIYIANIIKCRPPSNRLPSKVEITSCLPYLLRQLSLIKPKVVCCLGATSTMVLLGRQSVTMNQMRGKCFDTPYGKVFVTFHPSYIVRRGFIDLPIFKSDVRSALCLAGIISA